MVVLDADKITVNEEIPYISQEGIKVLMKLRISITKQYANFSYF